MGSITVDASYNLTPSYSLVYGNIDCLMPAGIKNTFKQLSIGVDLSNGTNINNKVDAFENIFENCGEAIKITNSIGTRLFSNEILMNDILSEKSNHIAFTGIGFDNSSNFIAEKNNIAMGTLGFNNNSNHNYVGIQVNNSDMTPTLNPPKFSYIFHNSVSFSGNLPGYSTNGLIASNLNLRLNLLCNTFTNLSKGMVFTGNLGNQCFISPNPVGADNSFIGIPNPNDMIDGNALFAPITYFNGSYIYPGSNNINTIQGAISKCDVNSYGTTSDYYCNTGKGKLELGEPIGGGGSGNGDNASISVAPNPANNSLTITLQNLSNAPFDICISNSNGLDLINKHFDNFSALTSIDIQSLMEGFYNIRFINNLGEFASTHFIVLRP